MSFIISVCFVNISKHLWGAGFFTGFFFPKLLYHILNSMVPYSQTPTDRYAILFVHTYYIMLIYDKKVIFIYTLLMFFGGFLADIGTVCWYIYFLFNFIKQSFVTGLVKRLE